MIDGRRSNPANNPFTAPNAAPITTTQGSSRGIGIPTVASHPEAMLHTANWDPTEMSISPARITIVIPIATINVAALFKARSLKLPGLKNDGDAAATTTSNAARAPADEISCL